MIFFRNNGGINVKKLYIIAFKHIDIKISEQQLLNKNYSIFLNEISKLPKSVVNS